MCGALKAYFHRIILDVTLSFSHYVSLLKFFTLQLVYNRPHRPHSLSVCSAPCSTRPLCASFICCQTEMENSLVHNNLCGSFLVSSRPLFLPHQKIHVCIMFDAASIMDGVQGATLCKAALGPSCSRCRRHVKGHSNTPRPQCTLASRGTVVIFPSQINSKPVTLLTKQAPSPTPNPGI